MSLTGGQSVSVKRCKMQQVAKEQLWIKTKKISGTLKKQKQKKRTGLHYNAKKINEVPGKVLQTCADQLAGVFTRIFNSSLTHAIVPLCLKSATIIPVPKKQDLTNLNNYSLIALTPIIINDPVSYQSKPSKRFSYPLRFTSSGTPTELHKYALYWLQLCFYHYCTRHS